MAVSLGDVRSGGEERFVLHGVPWHVYVSLHDSLDGEGSRLRMTYLEGELELMAPSAEHEQARGLIGHLLGAWCVVHDIELFVHGATTYRSEPAARGLEADESYSFGALKSLPDLAIEVVISSYRVDKLEVYRGLDIREIWIWRDGEIAIHVLRENGYTPAAKSDVLPALDVAKLASFVKPGESLTRAVRAYRAALALR